MGMDLSLIWVLIIAFGLMMYVVMDGCDLGIGILFPFVPATPRPGHHGQHRGARFGMATRPGWCWVAPGCWRRFPLAYGVLLSALYIPILLMLMGLILRGVAFEFRFKANWAAGRIWDVAFAGGSYLAAFCQGAALGAFIDGFRVTGASYDGGALDWLTPFSGFTGIGVIVAYALLGGTWLSAGDRGRAAGADDRGVPPDRASSAGGDRLGQPVDSAGPP